MIDLLIPEPFLEYEGSYNQCFLSPANIHSFKPFLYLINCNAISKFVEK
jgi:hypothetical protein